MRMKCTIAYDGHLFNGYQVQPGKRTVQSELEKALAVILQTLESERRTLQKWVGKDSDPIQWEPTSMELSADPGMTGRNTPQHVDLDAPGIRTGVNAATRMAENGKGINEILSKSITRNSNAFRDDNRYAL